MLLHRFNGEAEDVLNTAPPAAMHIGSDSAGGLVHEYRLAISHLNYEVHVRPVCQHGIGCKGFMGGVMAQPPAIHAQLGYCDTVNLPHENEIPRRHVARDNIAVLDNIFFLITDAEGDVQTCKRVLTQAGIAGEYPVIDSLAGSQILKPVKKSTLFFV